MLIETFTVGMLSTNCYVASCNATREAIIIDPGFDYDSEAQQILNYIDQARLKIKFIINTHGHTDHIKGNLILEEQFHVPICIHSSDSYFLETLQTEKKPTLILLKDGSLIQFGNENLVVLHTPGHSRGSVCLIGEHIVFTGDTLFACGIGRTDFAEGSMTDMASSLHKLESLPDSMLIYPGHGETSIIGKEKRVNPFLNRNLRVTF